MNYFDILPKNKLDYFNVLESDIPKWLINYINTKELLHQQYISVSCGTIYSKMYHCNVFFSSLDHSIAVALIIWHFTHDKKQTLAGLFHDIATPSFKHCVDFFNGDYMKQESTEELTNKIIHNSKEISNLLNIDNIKYSEVEDYHIYPIADNSTPMLCADRLEYSLSNALFLYSLININTVKKIYNDVSIQLNENNNDELGFNTEEIAEYFVKLTTQLSINYRDDKTRYSMQFIADLLKKLNEEGLIKKEDLYSLKEEDILYIIRHSRYSDIFSIWSNANNILTSEEEPSNVYYVHYGAKVRYIDPLLNGVRISNINKNSQNMINKNLAYKMDNYVYLNCKF